MQHWISHFQTTADSFPHTWKSNLMPREPDPMSFMHLLYQEESLNKVLGRCKMDHAQWSYTKERKHCTNYHRRSHRRRHSSSSSSKPCQNYVGSATWIMFLHSNLSWVKSSNKLHFFISIVTASIHVLFVLPLPLSGPSTCKAKLFLTGVIASLHWGHVQTISNSFL